MTGELTDIPVETADVIARFFHLFIFWKNLLWEEHKKNLDELIRRAKKHKNSFHQSGMIIKVWDLMK